MHWDMPKPNLCAKAHGMSSCLHCALTLPHQTLSHTAAFNRKNPAHGPENGHALGHGQAKAVCQSSRHQPLTSHRTVNGRRTLGRHAIVFGRMLAAHGPQTGHVLGHGQAKAVCQSSRHQPLTSHRTVNGRRTLVTMPLCLAGCSHPMVFKLGMHWAMLMLCDMAKAQSLTPWPHL